MGESFLVGLLIKFGYVSIVPLMVVEGPFVSMLIGFLASLGYFNFWIAYLIVVFGDVFSDILYYYLGYFLRENIVDTRIGKKFGLTRSRLQGLEKLFERHGFKTLVVGKIPIFFNIPFLIVAGIVRMPLSRFVLANTTGSIPKFFTFLMIGYYFGSSIQYFNSGMKTLSIVAIVLGMIVFGGIWIWGRRHKAELLKRLGIEWPDS